MTEAARASRDDIVVCQPVRTAVGGFGGVLKDVPVQALGEAAVRGLIERSGLPVDAVDEVIMGHCYPTADAPALGRVVALDAGLPERVTGMQLDRRCGSGLQAVLVGAMQVQSGIHRLVVAGGAESMSNAPHYSLDIRWGRRSGSATLSDTLVVGRTSAGGRFYPVHNGMIETAENLRREFDITRREQDEYALRSHERAVAAQRNGSFDAEIVPVCTTTRGGEQAVTVDEHPRADTTLDRLAALRPILGHLDEQSTVSPGNSSGQNDGAAACVVTSRADAERLGLDAFLTLRGWAVAGVPAATMGIGPVPAVESVLQKTGLSMREIDLIELNEAFAAQVLACTKSWKLGARDFERLNVLGSGISLGHPVGATGGRILATLAHAMRRRTDARFGLETMCIGGGQGIAAIFERVDAAA